MIKMFAAAAVSLIFGKVYFFLKDMSEDLSAIRASSDQTYKIVAYISKEIDEELFRVNRERDKAAHTERLDKLQREIHDILKPTVSHINPSSS